VFGNWKEYHFFIIISLMHKSRNISGTAMLDKQGIKGTYIDNRFQSEVRTGSEFGSEQNQQIMEEGNGTGLGFSLCVVPRGGGA